MARDHWRSVRRLADRIDDSEDGDRLQVGACNALLEATTTWVELDVCASAFEQGSSIAARRGWDDARANIYLGYASRLWLAREFELRREILEQAESIVPATRDAKLEYRLRNARYLTAALEGQFRRCVDLLTEVLVLVRSTSELASELVLNETLHAYFLASSGELEEATRIAENAAVVAHERGQLGPERLANDFGALIAYRRGDVARTAQLAARSLAERLGWTDDLDHALAQYLAGRWREAIPHLNAYLEFSSERGAGTLGQITALSVLSECYGLSGETDRARRAAQEALEIARGYLLAEPKLSLAFALLEAEGAAAKDEVQHLLDEVAALIDEHGILLFAPTLHERRAKLAALLGDGAGRDRELREAHRLYTDMKATGHAERLARELADSPAQRKRRS